MPSTEMETASRMVNHHQSGLETVLGCGRRWWGENASGLTLPEKTNAAAGTAYHAAVEAHERARLDGKPDGITEDEMLVVAYQVLDEMAEGFSPEALAKVAAELPPEERKVWSKEESARKRAAKKEGVEFVPSDPPRLRGLDGLKEQARSAVANFWHAPAFEDGKTVRDYLLTLTPLAVEVYVKGTIVDGAWPGAGSMDGLYLDADGNVIGVDHKTAKDLRPWKDPAAKRTQAAHYVYLLMQDEELAKVAPEHLPTKTLVPFTYLVVTRHQGVTATAKTATAMTIETTPQDVYDLGRRVRQAETIHKAGQYLRNPGYEWCAPYSCPFYKECVVTGRFAAALPVVIANLDTIYPGGKVT